MFWLGCGAALLLALVQYAEMWADWHGVLPPNF